MFRAALDELPASPLETFMTAASPGIIATTMLNAHYDSYEAYVFALARQMRKEYELIVAAASSCRSMRPTSRWNAPCCSRTRPSPSSWPIAEMHVAALNEALAGIPRERVRLHCCWGNYEGPHIHDVPLADILPVLTQAQGRRAQHRVRQPAPPARIRRAASRPSCRPSSSCCPACIDTTTNFVEHPEVVANRICEAVDAVGDRKRVIASRDCGFGTFAGSELVAETSSGPSSRPAARARISRPSACGEEA